MSNFEISGAILVRILANHASYHRCDRCGEKMFVKYASGLCPLCFNGHEPKQTRRPSPHLLAERAAEPSEHVHGDLGLVEGAIALAGGGRG
jgi:hypothetical protein